MKETIDAATGEILTTPASLPAQGPVEPLARPQLPSLSGQQHSALVASAETAELWSAMVAAQQKLKNPTRTKTAKIESMRANYEYKYAPIEEVARVIREAAVKHGLWYQQGLVYRGGGLPFIRTIVYHTSGQWTATDYPVHALGDRWQEFDAAVTRACRRGLMLAWGITPEDDVEEVTNENKITPAKAEPAPGLNRGAPRHASAFSSSHPPDDMGLGAATEPAGRDIVSEGWEAADRGIAVLQSFWQRLSTREKHMAGGRKRLDEWKRHAEAREHENA